VLTIFKLFFICGVLMSLKERADETVAILRRKAIKPKEE
jgi:hypothetical protein